jgi:TonB family protein
MTTDPTTMLNPNVAAATPPRGEAVGAEIPVTVHASRTNQAFDKNLPPVHEDTKTVIVLQHAAVVRLTATLTAGETVVLTNRMTGADVLCRVAKVKSQPGIQHYVDLEFTQRVPGFWGDAVASSQASITAPSPGSAPPAPPSVPVITSVTVLPTPAPASISAPTAPPMHLAPRPAPEQPVRLAKTDAVSSVPLEKLFTAPQKTQPTPVAHSSANQSMLGVTSTYGKSSSPGGRYTALVAAALLALLAGGAAGGYWLYSQQNVVGPPAPPPLAYVPPVPTSTLDLEAPAATEPLPDAITGLKTEEQVPESQTDAVLETRPVVDVSRTRVVPAATPPVAATTRTPDPPARRSNVPIGQLQAPKARTTITRVNSAEPAPVIVGAVGAGNAAAALLPAEPAAPAPPPGGPIGGQLQQPQLISSPAPVYPSSARAQRVQGIVVLDVLVDETGKVAQTSVISGPAPLQAAAQNAVRNWKYTPAQLNGTPIAVHEKVSVRFSLQQ